MLVNLCVFAGYILLNFYVIKHTHRWIDQGLLLAIKNKDTLKLIAGLILSGAASMLLIWLPMPVNALSIGIVQFGNFWLGFLIQFAFVLAVYDLGRYLLVHVLHVTWAMPPMWRGITILGVTLFLVLEGVFEASHLKVKSYDININKPCAKKDMTIVLAADLHMGYTVEHHLVEQMVQKINAQNPDLVVFAGDMFDNNFDAIRSPQKIKESLLGIESKGGVYAVFGNHDVTAILVGGFTVGGTKLRDERMEMFLTDCGMQVLDDACVEVDGLTLVGRKDGEITGNGLPRKSLEELLEGVDHDQPLVVLNHEPQDLKEYEKQGVDLLLSGHTHGGQSFPLNLSMLFWFENLKGVRQVGSLTSVVTGGVGVYGPFMRTFNAGDITVLHVHFE